MIGDAAPAHDIREERQQARPRHQHDIDRRKQPPRYAAVVIVRRTFQQAAAEHQRQRECGFHSDKQRDFFAGNEQRERRQNWQRKKIRRRIRKQREQREPRRAQIIFDIKHLAREPDQRAAHRINRMRRLLHARRHEDRAAPLPLNHALQRHVIHHRLRPAFAHAHLLEIFAPDRRRAAPDRIHKHAVHRRILHADHEGMEAFAERLFPQNIPAKADGGGNFRMRERANQIAELPRRKRGQRV